jgi:hypothetical protein
MELSTPHGSEVPPYQRSDALANEELSLQSSSPINDSDTI